MGFDDKQSRFSLATGASLSMFLDVLADTHDFLYFHQMGDAIFVHKSLRAYMEAAFDILLPMDEFMCYRHSTLWRPYMGAMSKHWVAGLPPNEAIKSVYEHVVANGEASGQGIQPFVAYY